MPIDPAADLGLFLADFGVTVVIGAVETSGILDEEPAEVLGSRAAVAGVYRSVLVPTPGLPALRRDDPIQVNGAAYVIRDWGPDARMPDGLWTRIGLAEP